LDGDRLLKFELSFDLAKERASLAVDGRVVLDGYPGTSDNLETSGFGIWFGAFRSKKNEEVIGDIGFVMD
jgi:hypothetical protein